MIWKISLIIFGIIVILWARNNEKREYNNGICRNCNSPLKYSGSDSQGGRGYTCNSCHKTVWVSYPFIDRKDQS